MEKIRITIEYNDLLNERLDPEALRTRLNNALKFSTLESLLGLDPDETRYDLSKKFEIVTKLDPWSGKKV